MGVEVLRPDRRIVINGHSAEVQDTLGCEGSRGGGHVGADKCVGAVEGHVGAHVSAQGHKDKGCEEETERCPGKPGINHYMGILN
jgi:hypothetical protein